VLHDERLPGAEVAADRLRRAVEELGLPHPTRGVVTVSVGLADSASAQRDGAERPDGGPALVLAAADAALYRAKAAGRNRVAAASTEPR
jgi:PleD family two-component response regulator